MGNYANVCP
jgi:hypothetical protein